MLSPERTVQELRELAALTSDSHGAQRVAWTPTWLAARAWFTEKLADLPVERHYDPAGNHWVTLPGASPTTLVIGSHLDSVPNGGWLDGALGVLTGLEILRAWLERFDGKPPITLRLVDWADEEGARFGRSLFGSAAAAGHLDVTAEAARVDKDGIRLPDAMKACGFDLSQAPQAAAELENASAYLELHIEQGPILEEQGLPLAAVLGTKGVERHRVNFVGQEAHSGSTPMNSRHDALAAAAKLALAVYPIAQKHPHAVSTVGSLRTYPGIVTAVVGRAEATLDQRDLDPLVLAQMLSDAKAISAQAAEEFRCEVQWEEIYHIEPITFDADLIELCRAAIETETGHPAPLLPSGPLHDAAEVARAGIPTAMMFVQSLGGISHNKVEDTQEAHLHAAIRAMDRLASAYAAHVLTLKP